MIVRQPKKSEYLSFIKSACLIIESEIANILRSPSAKRPQIKLTNSESPKMQFQAV